MLDFRTALQVSVTYLRGRASEFLQFAADIVDPRFPAAVQELVHSDSGRNWTEGLEFLQRVLGTSRPSRHIPFTEIHGLWNPCSQTLKEFETSYRKFINDVKSTLEREFRDHIALRKEYLTECNYKAIPSKINAQHYLYLACYQVLGLSPDDIAKRLTCPITANAIFKGIQQASREIGLTLRPARRGRGAKPKG